MNTKIVERHQFDDLHASGLAFWMIGLMHDNPLLPLLKNPYRSLKTAGLRQGGGVWSGILYHTRSKDSGNRGHHLCH